MWPANIIGGFYCRRKSRIFSHLREREREYGDAYICAFKSKYFVLWPNQKQSAPTIPDEVKLVEALRVCSGPIIRIELKLLGTKQTCIFGCYILCCVHAFWPQLCLVGMSTHESRSMAC